MWFSLVFLRCGRLNDVKSLSLLIRSFLNSYTLVFASFFAASKRLFHAKGFSTMTQVPSPCLMYRKDWWQRFKFKSRVGYMKRRCDCELRNACAFLYNMIGSAKNCHLYSWMSIARNTFFPWHESMRELQGRCLRFYRNDRALYYNVQVDVEDAWGKGCRYKFCQEVAIHLST